VGLGDGDFVIGRGEDCQLVLDDSLVSRRHAVLRAHEDHVVVEDLGSRNGVRVNGARIVQRAQVKTGDSLRIGSQDIAICDAPAVREKHTGTLELTLCPKCNAASEQGDAACRQCGTRLDRVRKTQVDLQAPQLTAAADVEKQRSSITVLAGLVEKALSLKRFDEAERILSSLIGSVLVQAEAGHADEASARRAAAFALTLAEFAGRGQWLEFPFRIYTALGKLMPAETIDTIYRLVTTLRFTDPNPLRSYLERLRASNREFGPNERFLLRRLEGLERLIVSG
jgi:ribosomal protein L40E